MDAVAELGRNPVSKHHIQPEYGDEQRLTRDGTAEPVSRDQILRRERGQGNVHFPCSADHELGWQLTRLIHTFAICVTIHSINSSIEYRYTSINSPIEYRCSIFSPVKRCCSQDGATHQVCMVSQPLFMLTDTSVYNKAAKWEDRL